MNTDLYIAVITTYLTTFIKEHHGDGKYIFWLYAIMPRPHWEDWTLLASVSFRRTKIHQQPRKFAQSRNFGLTVRGESLLSTVSIKVCGQTEAVEKSFVTIKPFTIYYFGLPVMKIRYVLSLMQWWKTLLVSLDQLRLQVLKEPLEVRRLELFHLFFDSLLQFIQILRLPSSLVHFLL